jgi:hypothetical protein
MDETIRRPDEGPYDPAMTDADEANAPPDSPGQEGEPEPRAGEASSEEADRRPEPPS